jgi:hypothetical protein
MGSTPNSSRLTSMKATTSCVGAQLRPEETGRPLQNFVGPLEFSDLLFKILDPMRLRRTHPGRIPVVDVGLAHPGPHRLHAVAELACNPVHRPVIGAQLGTQGAHHPHRSGLLLRAVPTRRRLPWRLFLRGMTPSSFPRSGASRISRAIQRTRTAPLSTERRPTDSPCPRTFRSRCTGRPPPTTAPPTPHPRHGLGQPILEHTRS